MTISLVSVTPADGTLGLAPGEYVEWRFANDDPGVTWVTEVGSSGTTIESGISSPAADPVTSNVVNTGWDVPDQEIDPGTGDLIVRCRPTGGWDPLTNYGVAGEPDSVGSLVWIEVWVAAPDRMSGWLSKQEIVGPTFTTSAAVPLEITTTYLTDVYALGIYSEFVEGVGGVSPYAWSILSGALPGGLTLDASTGEIAGTVVGAAGLYTFEVLLEDSLAESTSRTLTILLHHSFSEHEYGQPGEDYGDPRPIPPAWYHPHAPVIGDVLSSVLRIAYACADRHARTLTRSSAPPSLLSAPASVLTSTSWARWPLGSGQPHIPAGVTHVVFEIEAEAFWRYAGTLDLRLHVGSDIGPEVSHVVSSLVPSPVSPDPSAPRLGVFAHAPSILRAQIEVALTVAAGQRFEVFAEFRLSATGNSVRPIAGRSWWEVRR